MPRLPIPGSDSGTWGEILNEYLSAAHDSDGSLKDVGVVADKYVKPGAGIPRSDLDASIQASLDNADSAVSGSVPDASTTTKGKVQLAGDLSGTSDAPVVASGAITSAKIADGTIVNTDISGSAAIAQSKIANLTTDLTAKANDNAVVHLTGAETVAGVKTFSSSPVVPTPTTNTQAANKSYVDSAAASGAPDASSSTKGIVQLTGDLGGTATSPTVPGLTSKANDNAVVHLTGSESISGTKNFTGTLQAGGTAVVVTTDSRLSDQRTPTDGTVTTAKIVDGNVTAAKIGSDAITEPKLSATNSPSSGQMLTYAGSNNFTWVTPSVGGGGVSGVTGSAPIVSSGGATPDISITAATTSAAGSMSASDKTKLDGITAGAQPTNSTTVNAAGAVMESDYTAANTILKADSTGTPSALTVPASTIVGRQGSGGIVALTHTQVKSLLSLASGDITDFSSSVLATVGTMVSGNTESGITVTYNSGTDKFDFSVTQQPIRFAADTATTGTTGTDRAYAARTITSARMRVGSAPSGSALTVQVQHYNGSAWSTITTLSVSDGSTTEAVQSSLSQAQSVGHLLRLNVTSVGSSTAATDVVVDVLYSLT